MGPLKFEKMVTVAPPITAHSYCATKQGAERGVPRRGWQKQKSEDFRLAFLQAVEVLSLEAFADVA